jgi:hypothetical protein
MHDMFDALADKLPNRLWPWRQIAGRTSFATPPLDPTVETRPTECTAGGPYRPETLRRNDGFATT